MRGLKKGLVFVLFIIITVTTAGIGYAEDLLLTDGAGGAETAEIAEAMETVETLESVDVSESPDAIEDRLLVPGDESISYEENDDLLTMESPQGYEGSDGIIIENDNNPEVGEYSGTCGDNLTWKLESGVLTISGTGGMWDW